MSLTAPSAGDTLYPSMVNTILNILQQPAGGQDTGNYFISGNSYSSSGLFQSAYIVSRSRGSTPVSISLGTVTSGPSKLNSPATGALTQGGAQIYASGNAVSATNVFVGGPYTFQY